MNALERMTKYLTKINTNVWNGLDSMLENADVTVPMIVFVSLSLLLAIRCTLNCDYS